MTCRARQAFIHSLIEVTGSNVLENTSAAGPVSVAAVPPRWAGELVSAYPDDFALTSVKVPGVSAIGGEQLESVVCGAYMRLLRDLHPNCSHPVRIWNYLPRITHPDGDGLDRYMRFNAGRYQAFREFFGGERTFEKVVPAASAVGHGAHELVIYALASRTSGRPVANPRQRPPYQYSSRFGPLPPCFARAMRCDHDGQALLMIGGTASIRGEDSFFVGDLTRQLEETAANLSALIGAANTDGNLSTLSRLRVYYVHAEHLAEIQFAVGQWFRSPHPVEWLQAELCRPDLLVEVEGLAQFPSGRA